MKPAAEEFALSLEFVLQKGKKKVMHLCVCICRIRLVSFAWLDILYSLWVEKDRVREAAVIAGEEACVQACHGTGPCGHSEALSFWSRN